ncbi:MAG: TIGR01777 family oxidoreductase [Actinomycetota bacterium]|nr:TIGR01777 family oxidoreductase [Actinomycetota bacterium]
MKVVLAGGTGALGTRIAADLAGAGNEVVILTRSPRPHIRFRQIAWDGRSPGSWSAELEGAVLVNLAGALVDRRPTSANVELLRRSRVEPTRALVEASHSCSRPPRVWIQGSTTAIYGDAGDAVIDEDAPIPSGPPQMPGVARPWEEAARDARADRRVVFRMSLVLDRNTPVLDRLERVVRLGLGGRIASGRQWVSWIHVADMLRALRFVLGRDIDGVVNVTSPEPIQNATLMAELRRHLNRPWSPPVPAPVVRIGAFLLGSDAALALTGRRCIPKRLAERGFDFRLPTLRHALDDLYGAPG